MPNITVHYVQVCALTPPLGCQRWPYCSACLQSPFFALHPVDPVMRMMSHACRTPCYACAAQVSEVPVPVNITGSTGTVTYITLSAVNTTGMLGDLTVLQVRLTC